MPEESCNHCIEDLFLKAAQDPIGDPESIWRPVENTVITAHVEDVTNRLRALVDRLMAALTRALAGGGVAELTKAESPYVRMDEARMRQAKARLEGKAANTYTIDDWMLVVDYLISRYLPDDVLRTEAEYMSVRAFMLGIIQARMGGEAPVPIAIPDARVPSSFVAIPHRVLSTLETRVLQITAAGAAESIVGVGDGLRHAIKRIVLEHVQAQLLGQKEGTSQSLQTRLFDAFSITMKDMRRIAVTESGEACNSGYVATMAPGSFIKRMESYAGACSFCRGINGKVFKVVAPHSAEKNGDTEVWLGKSNVGRSASPRMRVGNMLMERTPDQMWWPAAGVQHPHCRGSWVKAPGQPPPGVRPEFADFMAKLLAPPES